MQSQKNRSKSFKMLVKVKPQSQDHVHYLVTTNLNSLKCSLRSNCKVNIVISTWLEQILII